MVMIANLTGVRAGQVSHYNGFVLNIRDYLVPPDFGVYVGLYNIFYTTDEINDTNGNGINSITLQGPRGSEKINLSISEDMYAISPILIWVTPWKPLGARMAFGIFPSFPNSNPAVALSRATRAGLSTTISSWGVADPFFAPVWLDWQFKHLELCFQYGFYAPAGKYDVQTVTLPVIGSSVKVESPDSLGFGFWTQQFQGTMAYYPFDNPGTAVLLTLTYEYNGWKEGFDLKPGEFLTLNWGVDQYLPLNKDKSMLLEIGAAGYNSWQVSNEHGTDSMNPTQRDIVYGAGGQIGFTYVPWNLIINFHAFDEYYAQNRFQGQAYGFSVVKKFW